MVMQTVDGKTRRRQRDSSSPSIGREPIHMSAIPNPHSHDTNRRVGTSTVTDHSRRNSISDKGRLGEEGPYKDGEFVVYSSGTDSGSEGAGVGSPSRAPVSRNVLSVTSKAVPLSSRRASDDFKTKSHMEEDMSSRSDRLKDREIEKEMEKEKELESNADGWERDGKGWVPKDQNQEGVRGKIGASSSSKGGSQGQGKSEKHNYDTTNNDEVRYNGLPATYLCLLESFNVFIEFLTLSIFTFQEFF